MSGIEASDLVPHLEHWYIVGGWPRQILGPSVQYGQLERQAKFLSRKQRTILPIFRRSNFT